MESLKFQCLQCGMCCKDLLRTMNGFTFGLTLIPEEIGLFPRDFVFPYMGLGHVGRPKRIVCFQLGVNACPYLERNECRIYHNRPLAFQSYPFEIEEIDPLKVTIDNRCRWFKECIKKGKLKKDILKADIILEVKTLEFAPNELEASYKLCKYTKNFINSKDFWIYDLRKKNVDKRRFR